jgi:N-acetyl-anhydromuramyl-L-alanine amidase AmpD
MTQLPSTRQVRIPEIDHGRRATTKGVVVHVMAGTLAGTLSWWRQPGHEADGAHICVGLKEAVQTADLDAVCWHAPGAATTRPGVSGNSEFVGIEHEGGGDDSYLKWLLRRKQRVMSANRCAWVLYHYECGAPQWGYNVLPHSAFPAGRHACPGSSFPKTLYMAAVKRAYRNLQRSNGRYWTRRSK